MAAVLATFATCWGCQLDLGDFECPKCGLVLKNVPLPVRCCEVPSRTCLHRGPSVGRASCGCGQIYHCNLLGTYCGDRAVVEFATIGADVLTAENYRRCSGCAEFSFQKK